MPIEDIKNCEVCGKPCELVPCYSMPSASEWYCPTDHKSYPVSEGIVGRVYAKARQKAVEGGTRGA